MNIWNDFSNAAIPKLKARRVLLKYFITKARIANNVTLTGPCSYSENFIRITDATGAIVDLKFRYKKSQERYFRLIKILTRLKGDTT